MTLYLITTVTRLARDCPRPQSRRDMDRKLMARHCDMMLAGFAVLALAGIFAGMLWLISLVP